jgi:transposase-like protein
MSRQTSPEERTGFYRRHVQGATYETIAADYGVSVECVRYWCRKQQKGMGVHSQWHLPRRGVLSQFGERIQQQVHQLRQENPGWGPISIRSALERDPQWAKEPLPSVASIGRYLHSFPEYRRGPKKKVER